MTFEEYQDKAASTALYPTCFVEGEDEDNDVAWVYPAFGLVGETGELIEKLKKIIRNNNGEIRPEQYEDLEKELGDVLWYLSALCSELGLDLDEVAEKNIKKLQYRMERDVIKSEGDNR